MKVLYQVKNKSMGKYRCVTLPGDKLTPPENLLSGAKGEIREYTDASGKKVFRALQVYQAKGGVSEKLIPFDYNKLSHWVVKLEVPSNPVDQLFWANNPNARLDKWEADRKRLPTDEDEGNV